MGFVYHANYLIWMDMARTEHLREQGVSYKELEQQGIFLAVTDVHVRYRLAARYDAAVIRDALANPNPAVRRQAALAAGRIGDAAAVDLLLPVLNDTSPPVQAAAAFALGLLKDARALPALLQLVRAAPAAEQ